MARCGAPSHADFPPHLSSRVAQDSCLHAVLPQGALIDLVDDDWRMETLPDTGRSRRSRAPRGRAGGREGLTPWTRAQM